MSPLRLPPLATTGIGSLPHMKVEPAIRLAFAVDIPYLPQLPQRDPAEGMIAQALDGLPGLRPGAAGGCTVALAIWRKEAAALDRKLDRALDRGEVEPFEPQAASWRAFRPFLAELARREGRLAKLQLAGPATCAALLALDDGRPAGVEQSLVEQASRLILARALAMARAVVRLDAAPIVFFDEPSIAKLDPRNPRHGLRLQELRLAATRLQKEGARSGIHCCGGGPWPALLGLGLGFLSIDAALSLGPILAEPSLPRFLEEGGRLVLGIVPAGGDGVEAAKAARLTLEASGLAERILAHALVTPACGLGLRTIPEAERTFVDLDLARAGLR